MEKRTIKFRGIRIDNGHLVRGVRHNYGDGVFICLKELNSNNGDMYKVSCSEVIPESVGQYTGLKDKNGVEIYEGDIVKVKAYNKFFNVEVEYLNHGYLPFIYIDEKCGIGNIDNKECFVIGNIHHKKQGGKIWKKGQ